MLAARVLTADPSADDYWPCFSPDGKTILFSRSLDGRKTWELYAIPADGGDARRFLRAPVPVSATRANWSWRADAVAFTGTSADGVSGVWIADGAGVKAERVPLTGVSDGLLYPAWYPDARRLAVLDSEAQAIVSIDRAGGAAARLTDPRTVYAGMPRVSPDGGWIAFAGQKNTGAPYDQAKNAIWLLGEDGELRPLEAVAAQGRTPAWSPDGRRIAFQSNRGRADGFHAIFVANEDGTGLLRVTGYERDANHPEWSPDGKQLVFTVRHSADSRATGIAITDAPSAAVEVETASDHPDERAIAERVRRVIEKKRLHPWLFTRRIRIDRTAPIPHSHPVLTLNTDFRTDDEVLSSVIHEQFHWFVLRDQKALGAAVRELKARYPDAPAGPPRGARDLNSTYLHLLVCSLEYEGLERKIGRRKAERLLSEMNHYTWIYRTVVKDRKDLRAILARHRLALP